jgi:hypothetical protein
MCSAHGEHASNPVCNYQSSYQVRNCWVPASFDVGSHWEIHGVNHTYQVRTSYWQNFYAGLFTRYIHLLKHSRMGTRSSSCSVIVRWTPYSRIVMVGWIKHWRCSEYRLYFHFLTRDWTHTFRLTLVLRFSMISTRWGTRPRSCTRNCSNWFQHFLTPVQSQTGHRYVFSLDPRHWL